MTMGAVNTDAFAVDHPTTLDHVAAIVGVRTYFQVVWIYTRRIVAAMSNDHPIGNLAVR